MTDTPVTEIAIVTPKALDLFAAFGSNKDSEENGLWVDLNGVTKFKIRAFNAKAVMDLRESLMKPYQTMIRANLDLPDNINEDIGLKVIAGAVLADWTGVEISGENLPYSSDAAFTLFKKLPSLADFIAKSAMNKALYRDADLQDGAKNS